MLPDLPEDDLEKSKTFSSLRAAYPCATRCANGMNGMVYFPQAGQDLRVDLRRISGEVKAWWFDPRNGKMYPLGDYPNKIVNFTSPLAGPDWVLGLDSVSLCT
jgi:hypothetical protein